MVEIDREQEIDRERSQATLVPLSEEDVDVELMRLGYVPGQSGYLAQMADLFFPETLEGSDRIVWYRTQDAPTVYS